MKTLLIKIGKAGKTLQRDGLIRGGQRVLWSFFAMFRRVKAGDILFITGGVGDSALYRCHHVAEELEINGFRCSITVQDNPFLSTYADKFKIFIFHRVLFTSSVEKLIEKIKTKNKEIIFETDDLVFDPQYLKFMDYFKEMNSFEKKLYENGVGGEVLRDSYVKVCTTTTTYLAEKLREFNKKVFIVPNKLSKKDVEIADDIIRNMKHVTCNIKQKPCNMKQKPCNMKHVTNDKEKKMLHATCYMLHDKCATCYMLHDKVRLGYFSGTISHNKDFAVITEALMQIMEKFPQTELFLVGPLDLENKLNKFKERIKQLPYVPREKHFANVASVDINLAPLEMGNPFCESKSELKFFEAGIVAVPTIASATGTFQEAILDGVDGFTASDTSEWTNKLSRLILEPNLRSGMGQKARQKALKRYSTQTAKNEEYYAFLRSKLSNEIR